MNAGGFGERVQQYLRASGYSQKNLAAALGLHPKVLSRKLHGSGNARLTRLEILSIVITLALWNVITTRDEALSLLELAQAGPTSFSASEGHTAPLNQLAAEHPPLALRHNLPAPVTRLIGRAGTVERLQQLLGRDGVRLVTLFGPGGSGKTRLALHVSGELVGSFAHGVWFVALAGVSDPALVPMSIIQALNMKPALHLPPLQSLVNYLQDKQLLLVLDNFEQVGEAASVVSELLAAAPGLKVLITSRGVLHLYGECEFSVPPLDLPDSSTALAVTKLLQYSAIQLFVERAQAVMPDFALTAENAASIARICAMLDGLPLALELAAARVKVLPPAILLDRLTEARLSVLTGGARDLPSRQRALRDTFEWSYKLLSPAGQAWFPRLGVFAGGGSLEAAEAMMQGAGADQQGAPVFLSPLEMLEQLVDNSLLVRQPVAGRQMRFTMLETLREYALEKLTAQGELERLRDWHACYYLGVAEAAEAGLKGESQLVWLARLAADRDNFRAALEWSLQRAMAGKIISAPSPFKCASTNETMNAACAGNDSIQAVPAVELCLRLAAALRPYWEWQGYLAEGRDWLGAALALPLEDGATKTVRAARAKALSEAARLACLQNEQNRAVDLAEESIALWRQLDNPAGLAGALFHRGWPAHVQGDYELAKDRYEQGLTLLSPTSDVWLRAQLLFYLGAVAGFTADFERMRSFYAQSRVLFEQVGDKSAIADVVKDQGAMLILEGKHTEAIANLVQSIQLSHQLGHKQFIATAMGELGFAVGMRGEPEQAAASLLAARLLGAADSLKNTCGFNSWAAASPIGQRMLQQIRSHVDRQSWREAWFAGNALTEEQAIDLACSLVQ